MNEPARSPHRRLVGTVLQVVVLLTVFAVAITAGRRMKPATSASESSVQQSITTTDNPPPTTHPQANLLYTTYCSKCHGPDGHGDAESLLRLTPPPRDFAAGNWRFSKTDAEIQRVIREGIPGTAMASMGHLLSADQLQALSEHVLLLSESEPAARPPLPDHLQQLSDIGFTIFHDPQPAAEMHLVSVGGQEIGNAQTVGKTVLLNFWGTTCIHCLTEMPDVARLEERFRDHNLLVLSICADEHDMQIVADTADQFAPGHKVLIDDDGLTLQRYSVSALPVFILIDATGHVIARRSGVVDWSDPASTLAIDRLLLHDEAD